ncbi:hypothetical protein D3C87_766350 [compost metagenome]
MSLSYSKKTKFGITIYFFLAFAFYYTYVVLEIYRLNKSKYWISKSDLTLNDVESIAQLGSWVNSFQLAFVTLFFAGTILAIARKSHSFLTRFLLLSISLFVIIIAVNFILYFIFTISLGNLMQPLILPSCGLAVLGISWLWLHYRKKRVF